MQVKPILYQFKYSHDLSWQWIMMKTINEHTHSMDIDRLKQEISRLKKERDAVILAHNYQLPEVQDVADFIGDVIGIITESSKNRCEGYSILWCTLHGRDSINNMPR